MVYTEIIFNSTVKKDNTYDEHNNLCTANNQCLCSFLEL